MSSNEVLASNHSVLFWVAGIALIGCVGYMVYRHRQKTRGGLNATIMDLLPKDIDVEEVESLLLSDVVTFFKSLRLRKGDDVPLVITEIKNGAKIYILCTFCETTQQISNVKCILPKTIDEELLKVIGNNKLVVLS